MRSAVAALAMLAWPFSAMAHGVVWAIGGGAVAVEFRYTSGEPMAYAAVSVQAPSEPAAIPGGRTDGEGRFALLSEGNGIWAVTADDGMGHVSTATIAVEGAVASNSPPDPFQGSWLRDGWGLRILLGLSLIGNLAGLGYYRRRPGPHSARPQAPSAPGAVGAMNAMPPDWERFAHGPFRPKERWCLPAAGVGTAGVAGLDYFIIDSGSGRTYTVASASWNSEAFSVMRAVRRGQDLLQRLRGRMTGITRLLMLALCLQLASPLMGPSVATAGQSSSEVRLQADLRASLCHDGSSNRDSGRVPASSLGTGHCIFCLPLAGAAVAVLTTSVGPIPSFRAVTPVVPTSSLTADRSHPTAARPRAPPSLPRIA